MTGLPLFRRERHLTCALALLFYLQILLRAETSNDLPADAWIVVQLHSQKNSQESHQPLSALQAVNERDPSADSELKRSGNIDAVKEKSEDEPPQTDTTDEKKKKKTLLHETGGADLVPGLARPLDDASLEPIYRSILAAQIHLRFGVAEFGNLEAYEQASRLLTEAISRLEQLPVASSEDQTQQRAALDRIAQHLLRELAELKADALQTLAGRFPLIRAFDLAWGEEEEQVHAYLRDDAARRKTLYDALLKISKTAAMDAVLALVLVSEGPDDQPWQTNTAELADSQARIAFAGQPNVTIVPGAIRLKIPATPAWNAPDAEFDAVCRQILKELRAEDAKALMLVLVREMTPTTHDGYWVQTQQRTYGVKALDDAADDADSFEADKIRFSEAFTRSRGATVAVVPGGMALMALATIGLYAVWAGRRISPAPAWPIRLFIPALGFVIGAALAPPVVWAMSNGMPDPRSSVVGSIWWPCVTGALSLILPSGVVRLGLGTAGKYVGSLSCHGMWGVAFAPVAVGVAAGWIGPASYVLGLACLPLIAAMTVAGILLLYTFGRATDMADDFPMSYTPIALTLSLPFGAAAFLGSAEMLWGVAGAMALGLAFNAWRVRRKSAPLPEAAGEVAAKSAVFGGVRVPRTLEELRAALKQPLYQPADEYPFLRSMLEVAGAGKTVWIGLIGPSAAGKSAAAEYLIREIRTRRPDTRLLVGRCTEKSSPYQPFREALAEMGVPQQMLTSHSHGGGMNDLFDRLADRFIPFWEYFSGYRDRVEEDREDDASAPVELLAAVAKAISGVAHTQGVVLFLDDVQWIDEWSAALLEHLREEFSPDEDVPCIVILAARDEAALERFDPGENVLTLSPPDLRRQRQILEKSLGLEAASARRIVGAIGAMGQEPGGMFWLLRAIHELLEKDSLSPTTRGFALRKEYLRGEQLPMPESMRQELARQLQVSSEYRAVLECAALLGEKFRVRDLADCLRRDRLELLHLLRTLEEEQQIVHDLPADPECYSFSSLFMLRILRDQLHVGGGESRDPRPTKIAREWHARIAEVLERRTPRTPHLINELALHYVAAGPGYEAQAVEACLASARISERQKQSKDTLDWLRRARQAARSGRITLTAEVCEEFAELLDHQAESTADGASPDQRAEPVRSAAHSSGHAAKTTPAAPQL